MPCSNIKIGRKRGGEKGRKRNSLTMQFFSTLPVTISRVTEGGKGRRVTWTRL